MSTALAEGAPPRVVAFRDSRWKGRWIVVSLIVLLLWRSYKFIDRDWLVQIPFWILTIVTGFAPQAFLLIFPFLTRDPNDRSTFGAPTPTRFLIEFAIAVPIVIGMTVVLTAIAYLLALLAPGTSLNPDALAMANSPNPLYVYFFLLLSFTFVPAAEEVFFRGFLYNALRARMPAFVAALVQSLIFGAGHFFGATHAGLAIVIGLILTAIYEWRKTLIAPVLVHAGLNFFAVISTLLTMAIIANSPVMGVVGDQKDTECVIRRVAPNSAAAEAGLEVGDIVTSFNSQPIRNFPHLVQTISLYRPGDAIPVKINRSGAVLEVTVVLKRRGAL